MGSFGVRLLILRPLAAVFAVYTQPEPWQWCSYMRNARWVRGSPWEEESRMAYETEHPVRAEIDQVITRFEPLSRIDFISHFSGVTLISRIRFRAVSDKETEISGQLEFVGTFSRIAGFAIGPVIEQRTREFLADLKRECEKEISESESSAKPAC
jgi:hypothetical protein